MSYIRGNTQLGFTDLVKINSVFDKAAHEHTAEKIEQERSWIQSLVDEAYFNGDEIFVEAAVVFGYMEVLETV
jgi:hypothetical protein